MNVVEKYNPANIASLSAEDVTALHNLTKEDINALAKAYPNSPQSNNYLVLFDNRFTADKQLFQLSSWENLKNLYLVGQTQFVPHDFRGRAGSVLDQPRATQNTATPANSVVVDLSQEEAAKAEGLKDQSLDITGGLETVGSGTTPIDVMAGLNAGIGNLEVNNEQAHGEILAPVIDINANQASNNIGGVNENADTNLAELETKLEQLKKDGAHHMTIKAVEKQIADLKGNQ